MLPGNVKFASLPGISENAAWGNHGSGNGTRTREFRLMRPEPCHLAIPHHSLDLRCHSASTSGSGTRPATTRRAGRCR